MLNLVTIGKQRINIDSISYVGENEDGELASLYIGEEKDALIELVGLDAIAFLTWWDSLAVDVHKWMEKNG